MGVGPSGPIERGRNVGDGGINKLPNGLSEEVGEGVEGPDASDFVSASDADLSIGTMSRSHLSSSWEGHLRTKDFRRRMFGEERYGELTREGGTGIGSGCLGQVRREDRFLVRSRETVSWTTRESDMVVKAEGAKCWGNQGQAGPGYKCSQDEVFG